MRIEKLNENTKKNLLDDLLKRSPNNYGKFEASVQEILNAVKEKGDKAVFFYNSMGNTPVGFHFFWNSSTRSSRVSME